MKQIVAILLLSLIVLSAGASTQLGFPGAVPKDDTRAVSSDLFYSNKVLTPHEAQQLKLDGVDLSTLSPKESDLWKNTNGSLSEPSLSFQNGETLNYLSFVLSRGGNFRFSGLKEENGSKKIYTVLLSKKVHNVLLRAGLLKKLGYSVPEIKHLKNIKVQFSSSFEKENFLGRLSEDTLGDSSRWVIENGEETLVLQDVLVMESQQRIYNLAIGSIPSGVIQNRRVLNSLLVPFTLTDIPESVNLMSWNGFSLLSNNIRFDYEANDDFYPSIDDVRWMARRIQNLTRQDFVEIVRFAHLPYEVELLVVEKLISRRNTLLLVSDLPYNLIPYNTAVSAGASLVDGKLMKENWEGYASRFAYGDPESPLSSSQILALLKNKTIAIGLEKLAEIANKNIMLQSHLSDDVMNKQVDIAQKKLEEYLKTGKVQSTPVQAWGVPYFNTNLILSRDIVTGSYLGADNLVQLADNIGIGLDLGVYLGTDGLPVPWQGNGNVRASLMRRYSHIKPIKTMKVKAPWKNLMVPWLIKTKGHLFDDVLSAQNKYVEAQALLESEKKAFVDLQTELKAQRLSTEEAFQAFEKHLLTLSYPVGVIASLIKERTYQRDLELIDELLLEQKAQVKTEGSLELLVTLRASFDTLPQFVTENFELEKKVSLESFDSRLLRLEALEDSKEFSRDLNLYLDDWASFKKRLASMKGEELVQEKSSFLKEAQDQENSLKESLDLVGLAELTAQIPSLIEKVTQDLESDRKERMGQAFALLKSELQVGESLLVIDSLGASVDLSVGYKASDFLQVVGGMNAGHVVLSRLHIYRASENVIQIYKDLGNVSSLGLRSELRSGLPTLTLTGKLSKGIAKTKFYQLSLDQRNIKEANQVASALRALFIDNSLELVQTINKPFMIEHRFLENRDTLSLLWMDWIKLVNKDEIVVKHPQGGEKRFYKILRGKRFSTDYTSLIFDIGNALLKEVNENIQVKNPGESEGDDTYLGRGVVRQLSFEGEIKENGLAHPTVALNYIWKGLSIDTKKAKKIVDEINGKFDTLLFFPEALKGTTQLQLYNISANVYIYGQGIEALALFSEKSALELFSQYTPEFGNNRDMQRQFVTDLVRSFKRHQQKYLKALAQGDSEKAVLYGERMIASLESRIPMSEIKKIAGEKNFFVTSRIQGFRKGDENGDRPLVGNTWGEVGDQFAQGPLLAMKNQIGMTESEFFANWIMGRL